MVRTELREHIFKMLFQIEFNEAEEMPEHLKYYFETLEDAAEKDKEYIQKKYEAVVAHVPEIDRIINENAKAWSRGSEKGSRQWQPPGTATRAVCGSDPHPLPSASGSSQGLGRQGSLR